jgi:gliding motility-associated-like protein
MVRCFTLNKLSEFFKVCTIVGAFSVLNFTSATAQCCSNGVNLLAAYNTDFSAPFTTKPPGFVNDNVYSSTPGSGFYTIITSRNYGACTATPEFDHTVGNNTGRYLWFDTPGWATMAKPAVAWMPFLPAPAGNDSFINVTPNTDYVFSVWIRDLARVNDCVSGGAPVMGLRINGVSLAQIDLGATTSPCCPQWTYMCAIWNSGSANTALIKIESRSNVGFTDLGIDDVYFGTTLGNYQGVLGSDTTVCAGQSVTLQSPVGTTVLWSNSSTASTYTVNAPGLYWGEFSQNGCTGRDTIIVTQSAAPTVALRNDTTLCNASSLALTPATSGAGLTYTWQDGSSAPAFTANTTGLYWVRLQNGCGNASDTVNLSFGSAPASFTLGNDTLLCNGASVTLSPVPVPTGTFAWSTGSSAASIQASVAAQYKLTVANQCGASSDSVIISMDSAPLVFSLGNDTVLCNGASVTISPVPVPSGTFLWSDGSSLTSLQVNVDGAYRLTVSNQCGKRSDTVSVSSSIAPAVFSLGNDTMLCNGAALTLTPVPAPSGTLMWSNGSSAAAIQVSGAGTYALVAGNQCGSSADSVIITAEISPAPFSLGNDTTLCTGTTYILFPSPIPSGNFSWQDGSSSNTYMATSAGNYSLTVTNSCGAISDAMVITVLNKPTVVLGADTSLCLAAFTINAVTTGAASYLWNTAGIDSTLTVNTSGNYSLIVANNCGNATDSINVVLGSLPEQPFALTGIDTCDATQLTFDALNGGASYIWSTGDSTQQITVATAGTYTVTITNADNCSTSDSIKLEYYSCIRCTVLVPTAFSPNEDGKNDAFKPIPNCRVNRYKLKVYNRWGEKVYETDDVSDGWDGFYKNSKQPIGTFVYAIEYSFRDGDGKTRFLNGNVTLIR